MMIQCTPINLAMPHDADIKSRFFYWQGSSGAKYIHSVYEIDACPPLPSAVYVAVKRQGALRIAVAVGRFAPFWDKTLGGEDLSHLEFLGVDEVHVHLLAHSPEKADFIRNDLSAALGEAHQSYGLNEISSPWLFDLPQAQMQA